MHYTEKNQQEMTIKKVIRPQQDEISVLLKREEPRVRYLKLYQFYRETKFTQKIKVVPELRLCGNWLENAGFSPTNYVSVTVMDKLLIIRSIEEFEDIKRE